MPGQAIVTIKDKQWSVSVASTPYELLNGLAGVESMPAGTGMLFDLGSDHSFIRIDMTRMLFPLDIIFINSTRGVVGVMRNVQPGETDVRFEAITTPGARCFLEVNAGEAEGIEYGDDLVIQGLAQAAQLDISSLANFMLIAVVLLMMMKVVSRALEAPEERPLLYGPRGERLLPQTKPELAQKWYQKGLEAGRTEVWMDLETTVKMVAEEHPEIKDAHELVWTDIEGWEQTDRFNLLYGSKMWDDAQGDVGLYLDLKSEFWEGYLAGRKEIGRDIYEIAKKAIKLGYLPQVKRPEKMRAPTVVCPLCRQVITIPRYDAITRSEALKCHLEHEHALHSEPKGEKLPQTEPPPPGYEEWKAKLEAGYGQYRPGVSEQQVEREAKSIPRDILRYYFREKIGFLPLTYQKIMEFKRKTGRMPRGVIPHLPEEARGDFLFLEFIRDLVRLGEVISDEEAREMWEPWQRRYSKAKSPASAKVIPTEPQPRRKGDLEYLADSPEFLTQTIEDIGYRDKLDTTFQEAIARAKGLM
jgi:uncharacterized membrane protein (UPF0127 family)